MPTKPADATPDAAVAEIVNPLPELHFVVLHEGVGNWLKGHMLTTTDLAGVDIDRLLRLNAIAIHQE